MVAETKRRSIMLPVGMLHELEKKPKLASYVNFFIHSTTPERDAAILLIAQAHGCVDEETRFERGMFSVSFKPKFSPQIRRFRDYLEMHDIGHRINDPKFDLAIEDEVQAEAGIEHDPAQGEIVQK